ncbi:hypothetical protein [Streptomyces oceani]|uniref:Uncharacterized protein n=1 Tax=Streptomyces oceani TaxID=1075402 RepID=A0A1E7KPR5_9ACTN|nr:hypothetical protein [Streptomyces oceani]OEV05935.1 hypothetical protein AN216_01320 [Streptomyces oceani]
MPVDPTDPETFDDEFEDEPDEPRLDASEGDTAEQHAGLLRQRQDPMTDRGGEEADPVDAAEQAMVVEEDPDPNEEYR